MTLEFVDANDIPFPSDTGYPVTTVFDASGLFANIPAPGNTVTIGRDRVGCCYSRTDDWVDGSISGSVGAVPMGMIAFNTAGMTLGSLYPLAADGISGTPLPPRHSPVSI